MQPDEQQDNQDNSDAVDRWDLIRDIAVLQVKLVVDGLRDFILVPISLVAGFISVFRAGDPSGNEFYNLLKLGKSLSALGETNDACGTYGELLRRFPNAAPTILKQADQERRRLACP